MQLLFRCRLVLLYASILVTSHCLRISCGIPKQHRLALPLPIHSNEGLLSVFQPSMPVLGPDARRKARFCTVKLMQHEFGSSENEPYIGDIDHSCSELWDQAEFNLTIVSYGRQFDRLGVCAYIYGQWNSLKLFFSKYGSVMSKFGVSLPLSPPIMVCRIIFKFRLPLFRHQSDVRERHDSIPISTELQ